MAPKLDIYTILLHGYISSSIINLYVGHYKIITAINSWHTPGPLFADMVQVLKNFSDITRQPFMPGHLYNNVIVGNSLLGWIENTS